MDFTWLAVKHQSLINLLECCVSSDVWPYVTKVLKESLILVSHEWADIDIIIPVCLLHAWVRKSHDILTFAYNLLNEIWSYPREKIDEVISAISEHLSCNNISAEFQNVIFPEGSITKPGDSDSSHKSFYAAILRDAIILVSLDTLHTHTAKSLINKKAWLFRMIAAEARKKLFLHRV